MRSITTRVVSAVFLTHFALVANADTSLWIPGLDPQPISAGILGVGNDGRTTWQVQQGTPTGTQTNPEDLGFPVTATLVQGPSDAVLSVAMSADGGGLAQIVHSCAINNGVAVCNNQISQGTAVSSEVTTETVSPMLVQGGGSISGSGPSVSTPTSTAVAGGPAPSGQASAGSSPTSSGATATGTTGGSNGAGRHQIAGGLVALGIIGSIINCAI